MYLTVIMDWHLTSSASLGDSRIPWRPRPVWKRWESTRLLSRGTRKIQYPTRGHNTPARRSRRCSKLRECRSVWMGKVGGSTMSLSERLWRSVEYEDGYLRAYQPSNHAAGWSDKLSSNLNSARRHQTLNRQTPNAVYFADLKTKQVA